MKAKKKVMFRLRIEPELKKALEEALQSKRIKSMSDFVRQTVRQALADLGRRETANE